MEQMNLNVLISILTAIRDRTNGAVLVYFDTEAKIWPWHLVHITDADYVGSEEIVVLSCEE